ncbi:hypothetical protein HHI36_013301 [Cryptolaemus montrouzieri]|uniref:Uncharacterized protein n=1 Tax=Cryptolaemus montrouzieri TaxID=559131 RepID=A0ABD2NI49_9CUCU
MNVESSRKAEINPKQSTSVVPIDSGHSYGCNGIEIFELSQDNEIGDKYYVLVQIPEDIHIKINLSIPFENTKITFRSYSGDITSAIGKISVTISYKNRTIHDYLYIVPPGHDILLGRNWIRRIHDTNYIPKGRFLGLEKRVTRYVVKGSYYSNTSKMWDLYRLVLEK